MDTATLTTLLLVVLLTMAVALPWLTGWRTSRAMRLASLSLWVQAAAWLVVLMLPQLPRGLGLATLQLLAGLSFVIGQHVAQHWLGPRPLIRLGPLLLLAMLPLMLVFHEPAWVHRGMGALFVLLHELLFLLAVLWPASQRQPDAWRWRSLIAVPLSVLCVLTGVRAFYGLFDPEQFPALGSGKPVAVAYLMFGSIVTLCTALAFLTAWRREAEQGLERLALTDGLTGLTNRRAFEQAAQQRLAEAQRRSEPLALLLIDVDHFKKLNDQHGHLAGDAALCRLARAGQAQRRPGDVWARWGGEEFVLLLPGADAAGALQADLRLRHSLRALSNSGEPPFDYSAGLVQAQAGEDVEALLRRADAALYAAKAAGRGTVRQA
jgi:diguanylate cyclase (GGDEF)-like protein